MAGEGQGTLYVVGTPIGNLDDITVRAARVLEAVSLVACEDTRRTRKLLTHLGIKTRVMSCHEHKEKACAEAVIEALASGADVAFVSDAGTPGLSDPGRVLVERVWKAGFPVAPIPGVSALTAALSVSGLSGDSFYFAGFLPAKKEARQKALKGLAGLPVSLVFFEAPHRIKAFLADLIDVLGDRSVLLGRELTKVHESILRGRASEVAAKIEEQEPRGEMTVIVEGACVCEDEDRTPELDAARRVMEAMTTRRALSRRDAASLLSSLTGLSRKTLYGLSCGCETD